MAKKEQQSAAARGGAFAGAYMVDALYSQLVGFCRGILADGAIADAEIVSLHEWLATFGAHLPDWPCQVLARNVIAALEDGYISEDERQDLKAFVERMVGDGLGQRYDEPIGLPLDDPPPAIVHYHKTFCLTGTFIFGPRREVTSRIKDLRGRVTEEPHQADYLVIGATITPSWKYGTHGLKIEAAVERRASWPTPLIISERHWVTTLPSK